MRRLVHLSDLHFGRDRPELLEPLVGAVNDLSPDLVAISGDLTQRARPEQFQAARVFIDRLAAPVLVVPGNHDVPLHNVFARVLLPWRHYRRWISRDLEPEHRDEEMIVLGVNTVNPLVWQSGWFTRGALARVRRAFADTKGRRVRIVVAHHPFEHLPGERKKLMRGAEEAIIQLSVLKTDVVLSGHLHNWRVEPFAEKPGRTTALQVHAGTGLSNRLRGGEPNDFNLLEIGDGVIEITRHVAAGDAGAFTPDETRRFVIRPSGWVAHSPG